MKPLQSVKIAYLLCAVLLQAVTSGAQPVTAAAGGHFQSLFIKSDGSLWAMGSSLATGTNSNPDRPAEIIGSNVTMIAAGNQSSLFVKTDGSLWGMGSDVNGQLGGVGPFPQLIVASNVIAIAAGGYGDPPVAGGANHSLFLENDGSLWGMGATGSGQLGEVTNYTNIYYGNIYSTVQIVASNVVAIAAGGAHSLFVKSDGSLWGMGANSSGQLGDGTFNNDTNGPEEIVASNVIAVAAGTFHSLFLESDGSLWAMGMNYYGELGDGTFNNTNVPQQIVASNVIAISAGTYHSLFLKSDGSLWAMGNGGFGQLGDGTYNNTNLPEQIVANNVTAIAAGNLHTLFVKSDGSLWAMGWNAFGQLGDGTYNNTNQPEQIVVGPPGYNHISIQPLSGGNVGLSYVGMTGTNYELDWSASLSPANWAPQVTNAAGAGGILVFTNMPDATINNFWRIRSVP
jgi:alpha-tubulin suppressor-like RCC1 family protein